MKNLSFASTTILSLFASNLFISPSTYAADYLIETKDDFEQVSHSLNAGDRVILANGVWQDFEIILKGKGLVDAPIRLMAQTSGKVILSGQSNLKLGGEYLEVSGLVFKNGYTPSHEVISYRINKDQVANHSRVTEVVIDNFTNPDRQESDNWIAMYGKHNRFDHNYISGKSNLGVTLTVRLNSKLNQQNHHQIDHNYFGPRPTLGSNGGETIRIGTSHFSLTDSYTLVENNYFERCDGEVEIISVKSGKNTFRGNTFYESKGTLTLRHGNGNIVENNAFLGNNINNTGGIRVINKDQVVKNNYLANLTGYRFGSALTVMNGVPNSSINRYHQVNNAQISHNVFVDVANLHFAAGSDAERSAVPINSQFHHNTIYQQSNTSPIHVFDDVSGISFSDNMTNLALSPKFANEKYQQKNLINGFNKQEIKLVKNAQGILVPDNATLKNIASIQKHQTGPNWYNKPENTDIFTTGNMHHITENDSLFSAIIQANAGDVIHLAPGTYHIEKIIPITKPITIRAQNPETTHITFERSALFEIQNGGSLALDSVHISGENSPDAAGNSMIRTQKWGMYRNYQLHITNSVIDQLDVNHSYDVFTASSLSFADKITLKNNQIKNVTGYVLRLDRETDDLGVYNAEIVQVENNRFDHIGKAIINLYRGGTDESTFGPQLTFTGNQIISSSLDSRNKTTASLILHGVQQANINGNEFTKSAGIIIDHTVGEPSTTISKNSFIQTPTPQVNERYPNLPSHLVMQENLATEKTPTTLYNN